ncbi:MAG: hypothetical protein ACRD5B_16310 [Nitrososphaeraceae archaeon]
MILRYTVVIAAMAVMLVGATAFATDSAFATKYTSQAISQVNECGNGELPLNVLCQNIDSQVQGEENAVALDGFQQGGEIHEEEPPKP